MARELSPECLPAGTELKNYRILHALGGGAFGITYLVEKRRDSSEIVFNRDRGKLFVIKENLPIGCAMREPGTTRV